MSLQSPAPASCVHMPGQPWGFWATVAWGVLAIVAWCLVQLLITFVAFAYFGAATPAVAKSLGEKALFVTFISIASAPAPIMVLALAVRRAHARFADYMALVKPRLSDVLIGLACLAVMLPLGDLASHLSGRDVVPPFVIESYKHARDSGALVLLAIAMVVAAPVMEEFIFRGFLLPGFATAWFGMPGAIALASVLWAALHVQYEVFFIVQIVLFGLVLGWLRWRSGSTLLTLILHAIVNLSALTQTAIIVEWMS